MGIGRDCTARLRVLGQGSYRCFVSLANWRGRRSPRELQSPWPTGGHPARAACQDWAMTQEIIPFRIATRPEELDDLADRLNRTRWPEPETVGDWSQGVPLDYVRELCRYWA